MAQAKTNTNDAVAALCEAVMRGVAKLVKITDAEAACKIMRAEITAFIRGETAEYRDLRDEVLVGGLRGTFAEGAVVTTIVANSVLHIKEAA